MMSYILKKITSKYVLSNIGAIRFGLDKECGQSLENFIQFLSWVWQKKIPISRDFALRIFPFIIIIIIHRLRSMRPQGFSMQDDHQQMRQSTVFALLLHYLKAIFANGWNVQSISSSRLFPLGHKKGKPCFMGMTDPNFDFGRIFFFFFGLLKSCKISPFWSKPKKKRLAGNFWKELRILLHFFSQKNIRFSWRFLCV